MKKDTDINDRPSVQQLERLIRREQRRLGVNRSIRSTIGTLLVIAATVILVFTLLLPILQVQRGSMTPTLRDGEVLIFITPGGIKRGDIIAFHHGNQILVKRVIAVAGDTVDINDDGVVFLNDEALAEPYVSALNAGERSIGLPRQVLDNQYFVLGDQRQTSIDSRDAQIGMVSSDDLIGKALLRIWPIDKLWWIY